MAVPRILLAAAALTGTALACLTGCTPAESRPTVAEASSAAALADKGGDQGADDLFDDDLFDDDDDLPADLDGSAADSAPGDRTAGDRAAGAPATGPVSVPSGGRPCPAPSRLPGHQVLVVVSAGPGELTAQPGRYTCEPPGYEATGEPVHYGFAAAGVTATLVDRPHGDAAKSVRLDELITHLDDCLAESDPADPFGCYGNAYDVVLDSHGRIMRIGEVGASGASGGTGSEQTGDAGQPGQTGQTGPAGAQ
ncbi:hypothetical protein ACGF07_12175 [Kitasatospora sp. NPDC048194]|uniref:hypothetical protein n=1 Tax=Kitasatospora sp. NPDC048194 TaxID=3364045 RepID=UPI003711775A